MTFRITRPKDKRSWVLEEWREGGINQKTKKPSPGLWYIVGYYGKLDDLALFLLDRQIELPEGNLPDQIRELRTELKQAELRIAKILKEHYEN